MKKTFLIIVSFFLISNIFAQTQSFEWTKKSEYFQNGLPNQVAYIDLGDIAIWGWFEVTLTGGYNHQYNTGKYTKRYEVGKNLANGFYNQNSVSEVPNTFGAIANQWKLGKLEKDSNNHLRIPIYHLVTTGNSIVVNIKGVSVVPITTTQFNITSPIILVNNETRDIAHTKKEFAVGTTLSVGTLKIDDGDILTVAGRIGAREVKVTVDAGADFVFEKEYNLPRLDYIEKYIIKNKHLPEIASEKDMINNGINIGDFQIQLLQKIEELTFYTIEQEKEITEQKHKVEKLEEENEQLRTLKKMIFTLQTRLEKLESKN